MRVASVAALSWLAALTVALSVGALVFRERPSAADLVGIAVTTLVASSALLVSCYLPGLLLLRRRFGRRLTLKQSAIATGVGLNVPAFVLLALIETRLDVFAPGEALWFASQFLLFGLAFGLGHARYLSDTRPART